MKKRPTLVGLFSFGGSCPRVGEGDEIPLSGPCRGRGDLSQPLRLDRSPRVWHSRPQAAYSAPQPPAMRAKGPSLLGPLRAASKLPPRRAGGERLGQGPAKGPQASAPPADSPGSAAVGGEGLAAATPGGEGGGRALPARPAPQAGPCGKAGRSAADRAGGADGPTAPTQWGPGRPGAPTPQPARGRSNARPHEVRPLAGLALRCGGVPPSNGGGQLDGDGPTGPGLGRHITPGRPRGPDGSPHHRPQAVAPLERSPGAGRPGAMKCGQRREPLSECGPGLRSGRATGATARKPPPRGRADGPQLRAPAPAGAGSAFKG